MQLPNIFGTLVVRTKGEPMAMTSAVRGAVWSVDKDQPVWKIRTQASLLDRYGYSRRRFYASVLAGFSMFALLLTAVGIYGVIRFWVEQRTREIGVRVALGARPGDILRLVTVQGIHMTVAGLVVGVPAAVGLATLIKSQLFGIQPNDPPTLATVALILTVVAIAASFLPARRAARRDPLDALRADG
jgi:putative ABC transport system permease protein